MPDAEIVAMELAQITCGKPAHAMAPMHIARGVQNKILEGMAMAKPVVTTAQVNPLPAPPTTLVISENSAEGLTRGVDAVDIAQPVCGDRLEAHEARAEH